MNALHPALGGLAALLLAPLAYAGSTIDETRSITMDGLVQVENLAGLIDITAWDRAEVHIGGELGDDVEELEITESKSGVQVRVRNRKNRRNVDESTLRLKVPASASIEAESVSADISVKGTDGASLVLNSVSGDLTVRANAQRMELESVSGDVSFIGKSPRSSVETVSGEIELQGIEREITVSTVSGDVNLDGKGIERARFESVSGDLELRLDVLDGGRLNAENMSGDVELSLPKDQQADFSAQTYSGDISSEFGSVSRGSHGSEKRFSHRAGNNGAMITVESFSGDIEITRH